MECAEGKKSPHEMEGMPLIEKGFIFSVPRLHYACLHSLPFSSLLLIPPHQDAETVMSQAVSPPTVTQAPEPTPAPSPLSSPAPVALTSAMPITASCLLRGALGLLAPRVPRLSQVAPQGAGAGRGLGPRIG